MSKKIVSVLLIIAIIFGMALSIYLTIKIRNNSQEIEEPNEKTNPEETPQQNNQEEIPDNTQENRDNEKIENEKEEHTGEYSVPDNKEGEILTESQALVIETQVRDCFRNFEFQEGIEIIKDAIKKYNFDENGKKLESLYYEASLITNLENASEEGIRNITHSMTDPELLLLSALSSPTYIRSLMILSDDSILPIYDEGNAKIISHELETGDKLERIKVMYPTIDKLHKFKIAVENYSLYAYIIQYPEGIARLHSFEEEVPNSTDYYTLKRYKEITNRQ